jgi:hypothetical protein
MKRDYETGVAEDIIFFTGVEVEHTPAYGMHTLFVDGVQRVEVIKEKLLNVEHQDDEIAYPGEIRHIFFGANHSFNPGTNFPQDASNWDRWEDMLMPFLDEGYLVTLDVPMDHAEALLESGMIERDNFIPQIRIPLPYIKQYNYNTMIKLDDKDFKATNPGVWCHRLHDLMDSTKFTDWSKYGLDKVLK